MNISLRKDPRMMVPDLMEWFEDPFLALRPYRAQPIRIEEYTEDGHYVVRAEVAGIDPEKDLEVMAGEGYLTISAQRSSTVEDKHRSEFRYGSFTRTVGLPANANSGDVTADYASGILTVKVGMRPEATEKEKKIQVTVEK
jgi:HSP20 family molecular chaperone IbpA